ncbi:hypothetical protein ACFL1X_00315, partial [Candidatus Hydrogenedentota bacterium]
RKLVALLLAVDKRGTPYEKGGLMQAERSADVSVPSFPECEAKRQDEVTHITTPPTRAKAKKPSAAWKCG